MKGQFFIVATVIMVGVLLGIYQSLQEYSTLDLSEAETHSEAFLLKNIVDVSEKFGKSLQYKAPCGDTEVFDELKYFFESKASGPFLVDFNYTLGCTASNLLKNAYYNVTVLSSRARYFALFKASAFEGLTITGACDSAEYALTDVLGTKDAYRSHKIEKRCVDQPSNRFLWKKDNAHMAFKVAGVNADNVDVKAYTEQVTGSDTDIFAIAISSNGRDYSQCGTDAIGSDSWVVARPCSCPGCTDVYVRIKAKDTGAQPNILRKVELDIS